MDIILLIVLCLFSTGIWYHAISIYKFPQVSVILFLLFLLSLSFIYLEAIGTPKPLYTEWRDTSEVEIYGYILDQEDNKIYIFVELKNMAYPKIYTIPYTIKEAQTLQELTEEKQKGKIPGINMKKIKGDHDRGDYVFYPDFVKPMPEKNINK